MRIAFEMGVLPGGLLEPVKPFVVSHSAIHLKCKAVFWFTLNYKSLISGNNFLIEGIIAKYASKMNNMFFTRLAIKYSAQYIK